MNHTTFIKKKKRTIQYCSYFNYILNWVFYNPLNKWNFTDHRAKSYLYHQRWWGGIGISPIFEHRQAKNPKKKKSQLSDKFLCHDEAWKLLSQI